MSIMMDALKPALDQVIFDSYLVPGLLTVMTATFLGLRIVKARIEGREELVAPDPMEELFEKNREFYARGFEDDEPERFTGADSASLRANGWSDPRGTDDVVHSNDLLGGLRVYDPDVSALDSDIYDRCDCEDRY